MFNFYLNSTLYASVENAFLLKNQEGKIMLENIRQEKEDIISGKKELKIDSDEIFGYYLGQMIKYLIRSIRNNKK